MDIFYGAGIMCLIVIFYVFAVEVIPYRTGDYAIYEQIYSDGEIKYAVKQRDIFGFFHQEKMCINTNENRRVTTLAQASFTTIVEAREFIKKKKEENKPEPTLIAERRV